MGLLSLCQLMSVAYRRFVTLTDAHSDTQLRYDYMCMWHDFIFNIITSVLSCDVAAFMPLEAFCLQAVHLAVCLLPCVGSGAARIGSTLFPDRW